MKLRHWPTAITKIHFEQRQTICSFGTFRNTEFKENHTPCVSTHGKCNDLSGRNLCIQQKHHFHYDEKVAPSKQCLHYHRNVTPAKSAIFPFGWKLDHRQEATFPLWGKFYFRQISFYFHYDGNPTSVQKGVISIMMEIWPQSKVQYFHPDGNLTIKRQHFHCDENFDPC